MHRAQVQHNSTSIVVAMRTHVDSTPPMGECVGAWDGAIWYDFSSWTCPFRVGDMDRPLSSGGCRPAPFHLGLWTSPFAVGDMDRPLSS